jgi:putative two-component system response regulator
MAEVATLSAEPPKSTLLDDDLVQAASPESTSAEFGFEINAIQVMIVDDEPINVDLLEIYLGDAGYSKFLSTSDSRQALEMMRGAKPDVVLLDLVMPRVSGFDVLRAMRREEGLRLTPVIILTATSSADAKLDALGLGVNDFLAKPVDPSELLLRMRNTLAAKTLQTHLAGYSVKLERQVRHRTAELEAARQEVMHCLARAAEYRDDDTGQHVIRVGRYVALIAQQLGFEERRVTMLEQAAQLHDVGKIGIPDSVLLKPGKLEPGEFDLIKRHCDFGKTIIQPMSDDEWKTLRHHTHMGAEILGLPSSPIMRLAATIASSHHEKWDGSGYPLGLAGEAIPLEGRITAVADVFDALSSERPYKQAFGLEKCLGILEEGRGRHFDPVILDAFLDCLPEVLRIKEEFADSPCS